jgi:hypothetical protein
VPARELTWSALNETERQEVRRALDQPAILAEGGGGTFFWRLVMVLGFGLALVARMAGWGVVETGYDGSPLFATLIYGLAGVAIARGLLAPKKPPWKPVRALFPWGYVDARSSTIRVVPIADFQRYQIERQGDTEPTLVKVHVHLGGSVETFSLYASTKNVPIAQLDALDRNQAVPLPAGRPVPMRRRPPVWAMALGFGVMFAGLHYFRELPRRSIAAARASASPRHWNGVVRRFPLSDAASHARSNLSLLYGSLHRDLPAVWHPVLDELARRRDPTVALICSGPDPDRLKAENTRATLLASGAEVAPIILHHATGSVPCPDLLQRALGDAIEARVPRDLLVLERKDWEDAEGMPKLVVSFDVKAVNLFAPKEKTRSFAALDFTFAVALEETKLVDGVAVAAPEEMTVGRLKFEGEELPALGAGGVYDDILVYTDQVERAATRAAPGLAEGLFP